MGAGHDWWLTELDGAPSGVCGWADLGWKWQVCPIHGTSGLAQECPSHGDGISVSPTAKVHFRTLCFA